jgi:RND family efflux transporter MFP subunit
MDSRSVLKLSGTVRVRFETPVAFQLDVRIETRHISAGQLVTKGQVLFELDARDLKQSIRATKAEHAAAQAALAIATADVGRDRKLLLENFISRQSLEHTELAEREARTGFNAAQAQLRHTRNALGYANMCAEAPGILIEVSGEPSQVVAFGQAIAVLAQDGEREIEVFFSEDIRSLFDKPIASQEY